MLVQTKKIVDSLKTALDILEYVNYKIPKLNDNVSDFILLIPNYPYLEIFVTNSYVIYSAKIPTIGEYNLSRSIIFYCYQAQQIIEFLKKSNLGYIDIYENKLNEDLLLNKDPLTNGIGVGIYNVDYDYPHLSYPMENQVEKIIRFKTEEFKNIMKELKSLRRNINSSDKKYFGIPDYLRLKFINNKLNISLDNIYGYFSLTPVIETSDLNMLDKDIILSFNIIERIIRNIKTEETFLYMDKSKQIVQFTPKIDDKLYIVKLERFITQQKTYF